MILRWNVFFKTYSNRFITEHINMSTYCDTLKVRYDIPLSPAIFYVHLAPQYVQSDQRNVDMSS